MNLIVCLVPIVLLGMSVVKVGVIETNAPRFINGRCDGCDGDKPLNLRVHLAEDGIELRQSGQVEGPERFARDELPAVYQRLVALKSAHPEETVANLSADARVPYRRVIALMDVMRHELDGEVHTAEDLAALHPRRGESGRAQLLFPDVQFMPAPL
jgi:biopolymer transport protein ExbD